MIPYEELVAALQGWRARQGLPTGATDYLGEPAPTSYAVVDTSMAAEGVEEIADIDVAEELDASAFDDETQAAYAAPEPGAEYGDHEQPGAYDAYAEPPGAHDAEPSFGASEAESVESEPAAYDQPAGDIPDFEAMEAEYGGEQFGEPETAYSPVQSDAEVERQALDDEGGAHEPDEATMISAEPGDVGAPATGDVGVDAPEPAADAGMDSFVPTEPQQALEAELPAGEAVGIGADAAPEDEAALAPEEPSFQEPPESVEVGVDIEAEAPDEAPLSPPAPAGDFDEGEDQATAIVDSGQDEPAEPPPLAPPPAPGAEPDDLEVDALDVIEEDDDPDRGSQPQ